MRYIDSACLDDWSLEEIIVNGRHPGSDPFADAGVTDLAMIFNQCRLIIASGIPPDKQKVQPKVQPWTGKCSGETCKSSFYVLKAKPSGWRLYFMISESEPRTLVLLHAVNKKRNERDPDDFAILCRNRAKLRSGSAFTQPLPIPAR
jgi:hypothetical protein